MTAKAPSRPARVRLIAWIAIAILTASVRAQNIITVTSLADEGPGTLREALQESLVDGQATMILFGIGGRIFITQALPPISDQIFPTVIDGTSAPSPVIIDGSRMTAGSAFLLGSSDNIIIGLTIEDIYFDAFNLTSGAQRNIIAFVDIRNTRTGAGMVLLGGDDNIFAFSQWSGNATLGCYARSGSNRNQFGPALTISGNRNGGLLISASRENHLSGLPGMVNQFDANGSFAIAVNSGAQANHIGPFNFITSGSGNGIIVEHPLSRDNLVYGNLVAGLDQIGIALTHGARGNRVFQNAVQNCGATAIALTNQADGNWLHDNYLESRAGRTSPLISVRSSQSNLINDSVLAGRGSSFGVIVESSSRTVLSDLSISDFSLFGIGLTAGSGDCEVTDCRIHAGAGSAPRQGILVDGSDRAVLLRNRLESIAESAITLQNTTASRAEENPILDPVSIGIRLAGGSRDCILSRNLVQGGAATVGVNLNGTLDARIEGNRILDCGVGVQGLHLGGVVIDANEILGCGQYGINLVGLSALQTRIANNLFLGNATAVLLERTDVRSLIVNNTFAYNTTAHYGGGIIWNSVYWHNTNDYLNAFNASFSYCDFEQAPPAGAGNVSHDPGFVRPMPYSAGQPIGDFHLSGTSALIDLGSSLAPWLPALDFDGQSRTQGPRPEMGMDEVR